MKLAAWSSLCTQAETNSPIATPTHAVSTSSSAITDRRARLVQRAQRDHDDCQRDRLQAGQREQHDRLRGQVRGQPHADGQLARDDRALLDDLARPGDRPEPDRDRHEQEQHLRALAREHVRAVVMAKDVGSKQQRGREPEQRHLQREDLQVALVAAHERGVAARQRRDLRRDEPRRRGPGAGRAGRAARRAAPTGRRTARARSARPPPRARRRDRRSTRRRRTPSPSSGGRRSTAGRRAPITTTLSHSRRLRVACVTSTTGRPSSASERNSRIIRASRPGSRPVVGSSRNSSPGWLMSSLATPARLRWPPDSDADPRVGMLGRARPPR